MGQKKTIQQALIHSLPIMGIYLFVSMAYGLMMQEAGFGWGWSLLASMTVYTGAFQFVLVTFLSSGASILTIMMTALFMNSRQFFYGLTFVEDFKQMGKRYPYMVYTMTDETYAVNCSLLPAQGEESEQEKHRRFDIMAWVALLSRISWMAGAVAGGMSLYDSRGSLPLNQGRKGGEALYHQSGIFKLMEHHATSLYANVVHIDVNNSRLWLNNF